MRELYISPIKAVLHCLDDPALDFLFCTSEDYLPKPLPANVLTLEFRDTVAETAPGAFSPQLAARTAAFLRRPEARPELFVCCDCGVSRSAALAAAILRAEGGDEFTVWQDPHYLPNPLVYRLMCAALGSSVSEDKLNDRLRCSAAARKRAMQQQNP